MLWAIMSAVHFVQPGHSLEDRVCHALSRQTQFIGRRVEYRIESQQVILTGTVQTFFQKQMAQESLRRVEGIDRIVNQLEVVRD